MTKVRKGSCDRDDIEADPGEPEASLVNWVVKLGQDTCKHWRCGKQTFLMSRSLKAATRMAGSCESRTMAPSRSPSVSQHISGIVLAVIMGAMPACAAQSDRQYVPPKTPARIAVVRSSDPSCLDKCRDWIAIEGGIGPGTAKLFTSTLARLGGRKLPVLINSPGGLISEAVEIGHVIRSRGLDVGVGRTAIASCPVDRDACTKASPRGVSIGAPVSGPAICASACSFILAGGVRRYVPLQAYVGVHQFRTLQAQVKTLRTFRITYRNINGQTVEIGRTLIAERPVSRRQVQVATPLDRYDDAQRYFSGMGISPKLMELAEQTVPNSIHWLSLAELVSTKIDTEGKDGAFMIAHGGEQSQAPAPSTMNAPSPSAATQLTAPDLAPHAVEDATLTADGSRDRDALHLGGWVAWTVDQRQTSPALVGTAELSDGAGQLEVRIEDESLRPGTPDYRIQILLHPGRDSPFRHPVAATLPAVRMTPSQPAIELDAAESTLSPGLFRFDLQTQGEQAATERTLVKRAVSFDFGLIVSPERTLHFSLTRGRSGGEAFRRWREPVDARLLAGQGL